MLVTAFAATTSLVCGQQSPDCGQQGNADVVGTWQVLRQGVDCATGALRGQPFPALMTFNRGGTLIAYANAPGSSPFDSPEFGTWVKQGSRTYRARDVSYGYDENGVFAARAELTATVTLDAKGKSFTYKATLDFFGADGNFLFSICGMATGTRFE
jgi:hypothetical protein